MEFVGRKKVVTSMNIAPLIDVVFLLLIFFMLSSHFVTEPGIKITLPVSVTATVHREKETAVFIAEDNTLYLDGKQVDMDDFASKLKDKVAQAEKKTVIIKADKKVDLGLAVQVMDIAKQAEASGLIISTRQEDADAQR
jgi:biopolymer transport protein ExbD